MTEAIETCSSYDEEFTKLQKRFESGIKRMMRNLQKTAFELTELHDKIATQFTPTTAVIDGNIGVVYGFPNQLRTFFGKSFAGLGFAEVDGATAIITESLVTEFPVSGTVALMPKTTPQPILVKVQGSELEGFQFIKQGDALVLNAVVKCGNLHKFINRIYPSTPNITDMLSDSELLNMAKNYYTCICNRIKHFNKHFADFSESYKAYAKRILK